VFLKKKKSIFFAQSVNNSV